MNMKKLIITGWGMHGKAIVNELQQNHELDYCIINTMDELSGKEITKGTVWIVVSSMYDSPVLENDIHSRNIIDVMPVSPVLIVIQSSKGSSELNAQMYKKLSGVGIHVIYAVCGEKSSDLDEWMVCLLTGLFALVWQDGIVRVDLTDVKEFLKSSIFLYFGDSGKWADDYYQAIHMACNRAFLSYKSEKSIHILMLLDGKPSDVASVNKGIMELNRYCKDYFVTLGIRESDNHSCRAIIVAGVQTES